MRCFSGGGEKLRGLGDFCLGFEGRQLFLFGSASGTARPSDLKGCLIISSLSR